MRKPGRVLPIIYANNAIRELEEIGDWNEKTYSRTRAKDYIAFLEQQILTLGRDFEKGRLVRTRPDLRYIMMRLKTGGNAHVAVYSVDEQAVNLLHVFHSAQDWENRLADENT